MKPAIFQTTKTKALNIERPYTTHVVLPYGC